MKIPAPRYPRCWSVQRVAFWPEIDWASGCVVKRNVKISTMIFSLWLLIAVGCCRAFFLEVTACGDPWPWSTWGWFYFSLVEAEGIHLYTVCWCRSHRSLWGCCDEDPHLILEEVRFSPYQRATIRGIHVAIFINVLNMEFLTCQAYARNMPLKRPHIPFFLWPPISRNAFRLLQLHRYHLAAALFLLSGAVEEAALVLANHLKDLQLVILVTRRCVG